MALVLRQLGVPSGAAAGAAILFRMTELWLPLSAGLLLHAAELPAMRRPRAQANGMLVAASPVARCTALVGATVGAVTLAGLALGYEGQNFALTGAMSAAALVAALVLMLRARRPLAAYLTAVGALALLPAFVASYAGQAVDPDMLVQLAQRLG